MKREPRWCQKKKMRTENPLSRNDKIRMTNDNSNPNNQNPNVQKKYDLAERTAIFAERIIGFARKLPRNEIMNPLTSQLVRAGTSIGANYTEADSAESKKDFHHKIGICRKESKETCYWLRMVAKAYSQCASEARELWKECHEFLLIFSSINKRKGLGH